MNFPANVISVLATYRPSTGDYLVPASYDTLPYFAGNVQGIDGCHTEAEVLHCWYSICRMIGAKTVVETGVYHGLSTCFLAAAVCENGGGRVFALDPWDIPHLWVDTELEEVITWIPEIATEGFVHLPKDIEIDIAAVDSEHTHRTSWQEASYLEQRLKVGGYMFFHDSLFHDGVGRTVAQFIKSGRFEVMTFETPRRIKTSTCGPVSMGFSIARKLRSGAVIECDPDWINCPEAHPVGPRPYLNNIANLMSEKQWTVPLAYKSENQFKAAPPRVLDRLVAFLRKRKSLLRR